MSTVTITEEPLALENLLAIVDGARVELAEGVRAAITASRAVVDHALASSDAVYGLTTQVGHGKDIRLSEEEIRGEQTFLVMSHSGGVGPPLPTRQVRAALAVRLNGIARGRSGASSAAAEVLAAMLNAGVHPIVPEISSVGAADLGPMAGMAQVAIGEGRADTTVISVGRRSAESGRDHATDAERQGRSSADLGQWSVHRSCGTCRRPSRAGGRAADVAAALSMEATAPIRRSSIPASRVPSRSPGKQPRLIIFEACWREARCCSQMLPTPCRTRSPFASSRKCTEHCASTSRPPGMP